MKKIILLAEVEEMKMQKIIARFEGVENQDELDDDLLEIVSVISDVVLSKSGEGINLELSDLQTIVSRRGVALISVVEYEREDIELLLHNDILVNGAVGVLIHFKIHPDFLLDRLGRVLKSIQEDSRCDADIIYGISVDSDVLLDYIKVTVISTQFEKS